MGNIREGSSLELPDMHTVNLSVKQAVNCAEIICLLRLEDGP